MIVRHITSKQTDVVQKCHQPFAGHCALKKETNKADDIACMPQCQCCWVQHAIDQQCRAFTCIRWWKQEMHDHHPTALDDGRSGPLL